MFQLKDQINGGLNLYCAVEKELSQGRKEHDIPVSETCMMDGLRDCKGTERERGENKTLIDWRLQ